jgi:hypothetical protein
MKNFIITVLLIALGYLSYLHFFAKPNAPLPTSVKQISLGEDSIEISLSVPSSVLAQSYATRAAVLQKTDTSKPILLAKKTTSTIPCNLPINDCNLLVEIGPVTTPPDIIPNPEFRKILESIKYSISVKNKIRLR